MKICQVLAGFSPEEADGIRKMMGKKKYEEMKKVKPDFIRRCTENPEFVRQAPRVSAEGFEQTPSDVAEQCWRQIENAGQYAFNLSHGQAYALITTWGAYWKHHFTAEYLTASMRTDPERVNLYIREARRLKTPILPPDINESDKRFRLTSEGIRYGLDSVRDVGPAAVKEILSCRPFLSFEDYVARTSGRAGKKKQVLENLISIGAFDKFGDRADLLNEFYRMRKDSTWAPDFKNEKIVLDTEMRLVGTFITTDPMEKHFDMLDELALNHPDEIGLIPVGQVGVIGGQIVDIREHKARNGLMAWITVEWNDEKFETTVFADNYGRYKPFMRTGAPVLCEIKRAKDYKGRVSSTLNELVNLDMM